MRGEWIEVDGICEQVQKISEVDVMSFEEKYGDYLSTEQLAREFFVSTGTVNSWIRSGKLTPTVSMPFGSRRLYLFSPQDAEEARRALQIPVHDDSTIYDDFREFLEARDYSLSYKMPFYECQLESEPRARLILSHLCSFESEPPKHRSSNDPDGRSPHSYLGHRI